MSATGFTPPISAIAVIKAGGPFPVITSAVELLSMISPGIGFLSIMVIARQIGTVAVGIVVIVTVIAAVTKMMPLAVLAIGVAVKRPAGIMALGVTPRALVIPTTIGVIDIRGIEAVVWD